MYGEPSTAGLQPRAGAWGAAGCAVALEPAVNRKNPTSKVAHERREAINLRLLKFIPLTLSFVCMNWMKEKLAGKSAGGANSRSVSDRLGLPVNAKRVEERGVEAVQQRRGLGKRKACPG